MKRPVGIVLTSILQFLGSLWVLLVAAAMFIIPLFAPHTSTSQLQLPAGFFFAIGAMYLTFAAIGIATAVGVFRLKRWSRYSTLIFAGILVFTGLMLALVIVLMPFPTPPSKPSSPRPDNFMLVFNTVMVLIGLAIAGLGGWWLYYFSRNAIRARFESETSSGIANASGRPLSLVALAILNLFGLPWMLVGAWIAFPISFFGVIVKGGPARLIYLLFAALSLYLGIGLLRLLPASRSVAIGFYIYGFVNSLLFCALPDREGRCQRLLMESLRIWHVPNTATQSAPFGWWAWEGLIVSAAISAVAIYFLITRRFAFESGINTAQPPDQPFLASG
jgi:hypothetical protein